MLDGDSDGGVRGVQYFQCKAKHAIFAPLHAVKFKRRGSDPTAVEKMLSLISSSNAATTQISQVSGTTWKRSDVFTWQLRHPMRQASDKD